MAILGVNYVGLQKYDPTKYFIYPVDRGDLMGFDRFPYILKDFSPDKILLFQDIFNIDAVLPMIKQWNKDVPVMAYFPIDGNPVSAAWKEALETPDHLVTYTKWGVNSVNEVHPFTVQKGMDYLYHGVDTNWFHPISGTIQRRFKEEQGWKDKFAVISVNRFQPRKMLPVAIRAFALFNKGYKVCSCGNVYLASRTTCDLNGCGPASVVDQKLGRTDSIFYLHCNTQERMMGPGRANLLQSHLINAGFTNDDINKSISIFAGNIYENPVSEANLNIMYNNADVNLSSTLGEGVGLSLVEASAAGTTSIAPNNSAIPEMLGDTGHIVPNACHINIAMDNGHLRPVMSVLKTIEALEIEYQKWLSNGKRKIVNTAAVERVQNLFQWEDKRELMMTWLKNL